jgi:dTDP-4-dehydrorhamnose 3,5-epimerase-like enzyme
VVENNKTGERDEIPFGEKNLVSVAVPPNHTHALKNSGINPLLVLIYISEPYNPEDPDTHKRKIV